MPQTRLQQLRQKRDEVEDEIVRLADVLDSDFGPGRQEHLDRLNRQRDKLTAELVGLEERAERVKDIQKRTVSQIDGHNGPGSSVRPLQYGDVQSVALRCLERGESHFGAADAIDRTDRLIREDPTWAAYFEVHSRPEYESAWHKYLQRGSDTSMVMTDAERQAMSDSYSVRAMAEGATTSGGFVPVFIDPSVLLSDQESDNPFLRIARVEDITTNEWMGVSAAGVSWSFDSEAAEVSDDSITLTQPTVAVFMARGFIPYSIEIGQDWPGFSAEMSRLLATGYDDLILSAFTTGNGTNAPRGIVTALDANTNVEVVSTTDGLFGFEDIYATWEALPQKWQRRASWMMSTSVNDRIRRMGTADNWHVQTVQLPAGAADMLFNRPVYDNVFMPAFTGTTGAENRLVVGDFSNFVIARRAGMSVELVPHLLHTSNNRPSGQRGLFAWARIGSNSVVDTAFRLQQNR